MEALYTALGAVALGVILFAVKFFGGKKGDEVPAQDTKKATEAMETASELLGRRAVVEAQTDEAKKKVEETLAIEDPAERLKQLADQLKDL